MSNSKTNLPTFQEHEITLKKLQDLMNRKESFIVENVSSFNKTVKRIADEMERKKLRTRVFLGNRKAALGVGVVPTGIGQIAFAATAIGMAAHNLATYKPDYEIAKYPVKKMIVVKYKK